MFEILGACNAVMKLSRDEAACGVVTQSSVNHAQGVALAAKLRGIAAQSVMPNAASPVKRRAVEGDGATIYDLSRRPLRAMPAAMRCSKRPARC